MDFHGIDLAPCLVELYGSVPTGGSFERLTGDASTRTYYRLAAPGRDPETAIVMHLPADVLRSDEAGDRSHPHELPFLAVQRLLASRGIRVPEVYLAAIDRRVVILEDLGDETLEHRLMSHPGGHDALYAEAVDCLVRLHAGTDTPEPGHLAYDRRFDRPLLRWELDHFREWGLEVPFGKMSDADRAELDRLFDVWVATIEALPQRLVHRDYQSRNLMRRDDGLVVIDFQDALLGPVAYDLVALLYDSYVDIPALRQDAMVRRYARQRGLDGDTLLQEVGLVAVQRKLKDAGRFVFIDRQRRNPRFLQWYPRSLRYVARALISLGATMPEAPALEALLGRLIPGFPNAVAAPESQSALPCRGKPGE